MIRYKHSESDFYNVTKIKYENPKIEYGESVVDESQFRPEVNEVRNFEALAEGSTRTGLYDFPDGVDTGLRLTQLRDPSADITEIDHISKLLENEVKSEKKELSKEVEKLAKQEIEKIKNEKQTVKEGVTTNE